MKLTTTKVSIPVLMMMLFQSGHSMDAWFDQALSLFDRGQTAQAVRIVHQHDPSFFRIVNPSQVPAEIQAIINGTEADQCVAPADDSDEGQSVAPTDDFEALIMGEIVNFTPRGLVSDTDFRDSVMAALLGLNDITAENVQNTLKDQIIDNFYASLGFYGSDEETLNEVTETTTNVVTIWPGSDVPATTLDNNKKVIDPDLLGTGDSPGAGTIKGFLDAYQSEEEHANENKAALTALLTAEGLHLGALNSEAEADATYNAIVAAISGAGDDAATGYADGTTTKDAAVYEALVSRAAEVRLSAFPDKDNAKVPWGAADKEGDEWKQSAVNFVNGVYDNVTGGTDEAKASKLAELLYKDSAMALAGGNYSSSDELSFYLSVFGGWNIDGLKGEAEESFLQSILAKIEENVLAKGGVGDPGSETRNTWVATEDNEEAVQSSVTDAVYSVFGTKYEDLLRHSDTPGSDNMIQLAIGVNDIILNADATDEEKAEAVAGSIETFDEVSANNIVEWLNNIKATEPTADPAADPVADPAEPAADPVADPVADPAEPATPAEPGSGGE